MRLRTAGLLIECSFEPGLETFVEELREMWSDSLEANDHEPDTPDISFHTTYHGAPSRPLEFYNPERQLTVKKDDPGAHYRFSGDVTVRLLHELVGQRLLMHAGTVILPHVGAVTLTGASGAGKSTAVTTLARVGTYVTDELTILDPESFTVTPFAKPISRVYLGPESDARVKLDASPASLGITSVATTDVPAPTALLLVARDPDAREARLEALPLIEAVAVLAGQSSSIWKLPSPLGTLAAFVTGPRGAWRAIYAEASDLAALIERERARITTGAGQIDYEVIAPIEATTHGGSAIERDDDPRGLHTIAPFYEALWCEGELAILTREETPRLIQLSGLNALMWEVLHDAGALTSDQIAAHLRDIAGPHPDAASIQHQALRAMIDTGVVLAH